MGARGIGTSLEGFEGAAESAIADAVANEPRIPEEPVNPDQGHKAKLSFAMATGTIAGTQYQR